MGAAARGANKKEKYPKEGKENPKSEQNDRVHPGWVPVVVFAGMLLLRVVQSLFPWRGAWVEMWRPKDVSLFSPCLLVREFGGCLKCLISVAVLMT